jgi:hypothetical protein
MKLEVIRAIAKSHGINPGKRSKFDLIKSIQSDEGNFDCYASAHLGICDQGECLWRDDCFDAGRVKIA